MSALVKLGLILAVLSTLWAGVQYIDSNGYNRRSAEVVVALQKQADDAEALRAKLKQERVDNANALVELRHQLETANAKAQNTNTADVTRRANTTRLQFATTKPAECRSSGGSAQSGAPEPASDPGPAYVQLPEPLNRSLFGLLGEAESLKIDYETLYAYVHNPKLVCELVK